MKKFIKTISSIMAGILLLSTVTFADTMTDRIDDINNMLTMRKNNQFQDCIDLADEILKEDSSFMESYYNKSMAYYRMKDYKEALAVLEAQLGLNPNNELALYNAACVASLLNQKDKAIEFLHTLKALDIKIKSSIVEDEDFNNIKASEEFENLLAIDVRVGGELLTFDVAPVTINDRTMLPMRAIFDALGATVAWDNDTNTVTAAKGDITISLTIDNKIAAVNSKEYEMDVAPIISNDRTLVPVRFIADSLNCEVNWGGDNSLVDISIQMPEGTSAFDDALKALNENTAIITIDGMWPEPYRLDQREGTVFIIGSDTKALELINSLSAENKAKYMYNATLSNYGLVIGCDPIHVKFVVDGKVYYAGEMDCDQKDTVSELKYYAKGLPANIVKQYKQAFNYKDYYKLPESERRTTTTND